MKSTSIEKSLRRGFTLIEVLVAIVIIASLAALSSVGYGKFRERAKSAVSMNNLRQWGQALMLHSGDHNGQVPYEGDRDRVTWGNIAAKTNQTSWFNVLPPYVGELPMSELTEHGRQDRMSRAGIHLCPLVKWRDARRPTFAYMMNSQLYHPGGPTDSAAQPLRLASIPEPSATVIFADVDQSSPDRPRGRGTHVDNRQPGGRVHLTFMDGSVRAFDAAYVKTENFGDGYTENNKPELIWNPWIHPRNR